LLGILWVCRGAIVGRVRGNEKFNGFHGHTPVRL
jgi:hypothetical protein